MQHHRFMFCLVAALVAATGASACAEDKSPGRAASPTTRTADPPTSTTVTSQLADPYPGIWPFTSEAEADAPGAGDAYRDPVHTATEFMRRYGGMAAPAAGAYRSGDNQSGEVEVRPRASSPFVTTISIRKTGPGRTRWVVVAANARRIQLIAPVALDVIHSPVAVSGKNSTYEGNVLLEVREDGMEEGARLGQTNATGGGGQDLEPFAAQIPFGPPTKPGGAVVAFTRSAEDDSVEQLSAVRVRFGRASA